MKKGDDLGSLIVGAVAAASITLHDSDVLVITQKVISKAEGRILHLADVTVGRRAAKIAAGLGKDPRVVQVVLAEAKRIVRMGHGVIITETKHGFVCANSGVDQSNVEEGFVTLLPENPDLSARRVRDFIMKKTHKRVAVVITDTFGRPWREGQVDVAIGCCGIKPTRDYEGVVDPYGYTLRVTEPALVDAVAAAAQLAMGKLDMVPVTIVRGLSYEESEEGIRAVLRKRELDLFR